MLQCLLLHFSHASSFAVVSTSPVYFLTQQVSVAATIGRYQIRFSAGLQAIHIDVFRCFAQLLQTNAWIVPSNTSRSSSSNFLPSQHLRLSLPVHRLCKISVVETASLNNARIYRFYLMPSVCEQKSYHPKIKYVT